MNKPTILMNDYGGYAFPIELALALAQRGYAVTHVYTSASGSPAGFIPQNVTNFESINIDMPRVRKSRFVQRWKSERFYGQQVADIIRRRKPDIVLSANTPLDAQAKIQKACRSIHGHFIFWLQDFLGIAASSVLSQKLGWVGRLIGLYYQQLEKKLLRRSVQIIGITDAFTAILQKWRIDKKMVVIPNWAPLDSLPVRTKVNDFSIEHGLSDKFVVLYAGTMGMKQNPAIVVQAAEELRAHTDIVFVVMSDGVGMDFLKREKSEKNLGNLVLLPLQPFERLPDCLASADLGLVLLDADAGTYCVPSKVWSIYCSARPALLVVPKKNLAAQVTLQYKAGVVLEPENAGDLAATILRLLRDSDERLMMGQNGRAYAERFFQIEKITDQFEQILLKAVAQQDKGI